MVSNTVTWTLSSSKNCNLYNNVFIITLKYGSINVGVSSHISSSSLSIIDDILNKPLFNDLVVTLDDEFLFKKFFVCVIDEFNSIQKKFQFF